MSWFKDFFIRKDSQAESIPKLPERKPDISEPVISFVETFKANPKRFKVKYINSEHRMSGFYPYHLIDEQAKLTWFFRIRDDSYTTIDYYARYTQTRLCSYPDFLTDEEAHFIFNQLKTYFYDKSVRLKRLRKQRKDRLLNKQREALKKVYCK